MKSLLAFALGGVATYLWLRRDEPGGPNDRLMALGRYGAGSAAGTPSGPAYSSGNDSPNGAERLQSQSIASPPVSEAGMPTDHLFAPSRPADEGDRITPGLPDLTRGA